MNNKVALVTGSTKGIGLATAELLLSKNCVVFFNSEAENSEIKNKHKFNPNFYYFKADISNKNDLELLKKFIIEKAGKLDYLVANAGIMIKPCGINEITDEVIDKTINVNLKGTFWSNKIFGELIQKTSQEGSIVNLTSVDGIIGEPYGVIYSATKAGIISLTKSFARHFKNPLVRVNAIAPGLIDTPLTASTGEDPAWTTELSVIKRMGKPEEIAEAINFLLSGNSSFVTGQILAVDGGFTLK